jgi:hypothetical protein
LKGLQDTGFGLQPTHWCCSLKAMTPQRLDRSPGCQPFA